MSAENFLNKNGIPLDARFGHKPNIYVKDLLNGFAKQKNVNVLHKLLDELSERGDYLRSCGEYNNHDLYMRLEELLLAQVRVQQLILEEKKHKI
jgi:hypothetical protein